MKHSGHLLQSEMKLPMHLRDDVTQDGQKPEDHKQDTKYENSSPDIQMSGSSCLTHIGLAANKQLMPLLRTGFYCLLLTSEDVMVPTGWGWGREMDFHCFYFATFAQIIKRR